MNEQPDLLGWTPPVVAPFVAHSVTSAEAAQKITKHIGPLHEKLLAFLAARPDGATDEQMQMGIPMVQSTQRPRRRELQIDNRLKDSGRVTKTKSGRNAVVWILA